MRQGRQKLWVQGVESGSVSTLEHRPQVNSRSARSACVVCEGDERARLAACVVYSVWVLCNPKRAFLPHSSLFDCWPCFYTSSELPLAMTEGPTCRLAARFSPPAPAALLAETGGSRAQPQRPVSAS